MTSPAHPTTCTDRKEVIHVRSRLPRPCPPSIGGGLIPEAALAVAIYLSPIHKAAIVPPRWRDFAECVSNRESHHNYRAKNRTSSASGRWQFLDRQWRDGLAWMVTGRLVDHGMSRAKAKRIRLHLQATPIAKWRPAFQDAGFIAVVTASPNGWRHWSLAGSPCDRKAPR